MLPRSSSPISLRISRSVSLPDGPLEPRAPLVLGIGARRVVNHALVFGGLLIEQQRIVPLERSSSRIVLGLSPSGHQDLPAADDAAVFAPDHSALRCGIAEA